MKCCCWKQQLQSLREGRKWSHSQYSIRYDNDDDDGDVRCRQLKGLKFVFSIRLFNTIMCFIAHPLHIPSQPFLCIIAYIVILSCFALIPPLFDSSDKHFFLVVFLLLFFCECARERILLLFEKHLFCAHCYCEGERERCWRRWRCERDHPWLNNCF